MSYRDRRLNTEYIIPYARCEGFQSECQELRGQVAALQPLAGRVRALEGVETEEGGPRQRQRVGPAPHDAPPNDAMIAAMGLAEAVAAFRLAHGGGAGGGEGF